MADLMVFLDLFYHPQENGDESIIFIAPGDWTPMLWYYQCDVIGDYNHWYNFHHQTTVYKDGQFMVLPMFILVLLTKNIALKFLGINDKEQEIGHVSCFSMPTKKEHIETSLGFKEK